MRNLDRIAKAFALDGGARGCWVSAVLLLGAILTGTIGRAQAPAPEKGIVGPAFSKVFFPGTIGPGSTSMLTFTITNASGSPVTDLAFTDVLPAGVTMTEPAGGMSTCGGTLVAPDAGGTITFSDGSVGGGSACTIMVNVTSSTPGTHMNVSGDLTSSVGNSGPASADLTVDTARPGFSKSFSPSSVPLGDRSTLTFTFDNTANALAVTFLQFTDNLPLGMEIATPANTSSDCGMFSFALTAVPGTSVISLLAQGAAAPGFEVIPVGASCTINLDVVATASGILNNVTGELSYRAGSNPTTFSTGKAAATLEVTVAPLHLSKSFIDDPVPPGGSATLELTILNRDRDFDVTAVAFTDDLGAALTGLTFDSLVANDCGGSVGGVGTTTLNFSGGTVAAQGSCTMRVSLSVPLGAAPGSYTNTTSAITGDIDGSGVVGNVASDDLFVEPVPVLTKEFTDDPVGAGGTVTLEFTIQNTSTTSGATDITFIDELTTFLPFPVSVTLPSTPCGGGSSIAVIGLGTDMQGLSLTNGSLAPAGMMGDSCTFEVMIDLPAGLAGGTYTNTTGSITATVDGATRTGNSASDDVVVAAAPSLTKEFTNDPVQPGGTVTLEFTLRHHENAPGNATEITFTDDLAATLSGLAATGLPLTGICNGGSLTGTAGDTLLTFSAGELAPGESCTFSVTLQVPAGAASGVHANSTSMVMATVQGVSAAANPASDDLRIAGLIITKEFTNDPVLPGGTVDLQFTIENTSPDEDATAITFDDDLDDVLNGLTVDTGSIPTDPCGSGSQITSLSGNTLLRFANGALLAGEMCTFAVTLNVPSDAVPDAYGNRTTVFRATIDSTTISFDNAVDLLVVSAGPLSISKEFTDDPVMPGDTVTLEFTLTNASATDTVTDITFTDDLDAALSGLAAVGLPANDICGAGSTLSGTGLLTLTGGTLGPGSSCTFSAMLMVPGGAASNTYVNTTSTATGMVGGLGVTADSASDELLVRVVNLTKSFDAPAEPGGTVSLTFTIENLDSTAAITDLSFTDNLNATLAGLVAVTLPPTPCGAGSTITGTALLAFTGGNLLPGGSCTFSVTLQAPTTPLAGVFPNTTSDLTSGGLPIAPAATDTLTVTTMITNEVTVTADGATPAMDSTTDAVTVAP